MREKSLAAVGKRGSRIIDEVQEAVLKQLAECTCTPPLSIHRISEGKYLVGQEDKPVFVRLLRNHVMIRIGGGWDTFASHLDKVDPCRAGKKSPRGSKVSS